MVELEDILLWVFIAIVAFLILSGVFFGIYSDYFSGFRDVHWENVYRVIVNVFSVIDAILVSLFIFVLFRFRKLDEVGPQEEGEVAFHIIPAETEVRENWERIRALANSQNPSDWNMAIIQADALLDDILVHLGYEGDTMGDRLKIVDPVQLPSIEKIWSAHKLRNIIVHDPMAEHTREAIINALRAYQDAFKELKLLKEE